MATKKITQVSKEDIYAAALYQSYDDYDEMFAVLRYIIDDVEKPEFSKYQVRGAGRR